MNIYAKAAEILIERGWTKGYLRASDGYCVNGALMEAAGFPLLYKTYGDPRFELLILPIIEHLSLSATDDGDCLGSYLDDWNDADETTKDDVLATLEAVASPVQEAVIA